MNHATENNKIKRDYAQEIIDILRSSQSPKVIGDKLKEYHDNDIESVLDSLTLTERELLYRVMDDDSLADILEYSSEEDALQYLSELDYHRAASIIDEIEPDDAVDILKLADPKLRKLWLSVLDKEKRLELTMLISYDEEVIASRMTTNYVSIQSNFTIKEAMSSLVKQAADNDNITVLYVLDPHGVFYGAIDLKDLIIARQGTALTDIIQTAYPYFYADEKTENCLERLRAYSEDSVPVLDDENHIIGVITSEEVQEIYEEEMNEDYVKLAGLSEDEDLTEPLFKSVRKRIPWLSLLLLMGLLVSSVVGLFEDIVAQLTIIMAFQSLILDMSGNVGTQSLAVTIRVLSDENLKAKDKVHLIFKEMKIGGTNGLILGTAAVLGVGVYIYLFKGMTLASAFAVSGCIGVSLLLAMIISSLVGTSVPMLFKKMGIDPAVASGPMITTITDLVGIVTYYGLAGIFLIGVLGM